MLIYIASESGMPNNQRAERERFIVDYGPGGRLFSYYHCQDPKFTSGYCFNYLIGGVDENTRTKENTGTR